MELEHSVYTYIDVDSQVTERRKLELHNSVIYMIYKSLYMKVIRMELLIIDKLVFHHWEPLVRFDLNLFNFVLVISLVSLLLVSL